MSRNLDCFSGADRLRNMYFSPMRLIGERATELASQGHKVISFASGEPDFSTPIQIKQSTITAINLDKTHYAPNRGLLSLRNAISEHIKHTIHIDYDPSSEIIVTSGGAEAINNSFLALLNPTDEAIIFTPAFMNYENMVYLCGAKLVKIPLLPENDFQIDIALLKEHINDNTKLIVLNSPCNPTGVIYNKETLEKIAQIAIKNDLIVLSDEIYNQIVYDGIIYHSIASIPGMKERTILLNGFSKAYAMTGWRLGYVASDSRLILNILKIHQYTTTCTPTFIQAGVAASMNLPETDLCVQQMCDSFSSRRNLVIKELKQIPQLSYIVPNGAFYIFIDVSKTGMDGDTFVSRLLEEYYVACIPGSKLGSHCKNFIRLSFATNVVDILEGFKRIKTFISQNI